MMNSDHVILMMKYLKNNTHVYKNKKNDVYILSLSEDNNIIVKKNMEKFVRLGDIDDFQGLCKELVDEVNMKILEELWIEKLGFAPY
jgi:hypothetical protein